MDSTWSYPTATIKSYSYTYGKATWGDLLTKFNGETITYDKIGNPLTYRDGITMTWQNGRELASFENDDLKVTYTYDPSGLRTQKTYEGLISTDYVYEGGLLMQMKYGSLIFNFSYDANGSPIGFELGEEGKTTSSYYYYGLNSRGDVEVLYNSEGTQIASYSYDAYGKPISTNTLVSGHTTAIEVQPLRYRGYVYDFETGLYYLQSRYYDPVTCRFVNADTTDILTASLTAHSDKNLFAYCDNNPISRVDDDGECWNVVIGAAVGAVVGVAGQLFSDLVTSAISGKLTFSNWQTYTGAFVGGAVGGAILGGTGNVTAANIASGFVTTGVGLSLEKLTGASDKSWAEIGINAVADGFISYGLGKLPGVKNVTKGRNNMSAIYRSGLTKLRNKTVSHMSAKVIGKGVTSSFVGSLAMDGYYGLKQFAYDRVRDRM